MIRTLLVILLSSLLMAGCGKDKVKPDAPVDPGQGSIKYNTTNAGGSSASASSAGVNSAQSGAITALDPFEDPANPLSQSVVYFDYNSSQVSNMDVVNAHGKYLGTHPSARVRLEGHADERGSREFNVALSERRALEVKRLMRFEGVRPEQVTVIAFGEERPVAFGHNEAAWKQNRRVEIVYEAK